jgi:hypothetical protein
MARTVKNQGGSAGSQPGRNGFFRGVWDWFFEIVSPLLWTGAAVAIMALTGWLWWMLDAERHNTAAALKGLLADKMRAEMGQELTAARGEVKALRSTGEAYLSTAKEVQTSLNESLKQHAALSKTIGEELQNARSAFQQRVLPDTALEPVLKTLVNTPVNANTQAIKSLESRLQTLETLLKTRGQPQRLALVVANSTRLNASSFNSTINRLYQRARMMPDLSLNYYEWRGGAPTEARRSEPGAIPFFSDPGPQAGVPSLRDLHPNTLFSGQANGGELRRIVLLVTVESEAPNASSNAWQGFIVDVVLVRLANSPLSREEQIQSESRWCDLVERGGGALIRVVADPGPDDIWTRPIENAIQRLVLAAPVPAGKK